MKIRLATVVWGREYAGYVSACRSATPLLAEGNAPDLARAHQVIYTIYTTPEDARLLEAAPAFARLRAAVDVRLALFAAGEAGSDNYDRTASCGGGRWKWPAAIRKSCTS